MTPPGFPTLLAHPALAFALFLLLIAVAVALLLRAGAALPAGRRDAFWRSLTLLAEAMLVLGLIGLAVFSGRLTLAANQVLLEQQRLLAMDAVAARSSDLSARFCPQAAEPRPRLSPFNPGVAARELCAIVRQQATGAGADGVAGLQTTSAALRDFGARYPGCADNVFSRNNDCEATVAAAAGLAVAVDSQLDATLAARREGAALMAVQGERDWGIAIAALLLAAAGMAIRLARAAADFLQKR